MKNMKPILQDGEFVFITTGSKDISRYTDLQPLSIFKESEGLALIINREIADTNNIGYTSVFKMITLSVYSSLESVGFLAAIFEKLAEEGICVNPVSAFYHDHLFVPDDKAGTALRLLENISSDYL